MKVLYAYTEGRTYRSLAHLLLGLPIGVFEFCVVVVGLAVGVATSVTLAGIPILVVTFLAVRGLAAMERSLVRSLVGLPVSAPESDSEGTAGFWWARLQSLSSKPRTWSETGYLFLRLPLGVLDFVVAACVLALVFMGPIELITVGTGDVVSVGSWRIDTVSEALLFLPPSVLFSLAAPHIIVGWAAVSGRIAASFLGRARAGEPGAAPAVLAQAG
jgi:hypothetical protein